MPDLNLKFVSYKEKLPKDEQRIVLWLRNLPWKLPLQIYTGYFYARDYGTFFKPDGEEGFFIDDRGQFNGGPIPDIWWAPIEQIKEKEPVWIEGSPDAEDNQMFVARVKYPREVITELVWYWKDSNCFMNSEANLLQPEQILQYIFVPGE